MQVLSRDEATKVERPAPGEYRPWKWPEAVHVALSNTWEILGPSITKAPNGDPFEHALAVRFFETLYDSGYVLAKVDLEAAFVEGYRSGSVGNALPREFELVPDEREAFKAGKRHGCADLADSTVAALLLDGGIAAVERRIVEAFAEWRRESKVGESA